MNSLENFAPGSWSWYSLYRYWISNLLEENISAPRLRRQATTTAKATKTSLKKWICTASNFIALIPSRVTSSNVGKCFWSWILKDCINVQEKKRKLLSCVPVLDKTWIQALSRCSRATTAQKCTKKAWCTCIVVVLLIKPIAFWPFSLPSASSLLKLPSYNELLLQSLLG